MELFFFFLPIYANSGVCIKYFCILSEYTINVLVTSNDLLKIIFNSFTWWKLQSLLQLHRAGHRWVCGHTDELTDVDIIIQINSILNTGGCAFVLDSKEVVQNARGRFPVKSGFYPFISGRTDSNLLTIITFQMGGKMDN